MIYIKLENNADKFIINKYSKFPKSFKKILFKSRCRNGKFLINKIDNIEYIVLPELNNQSLKRLKILSNIRCWKNICVSNNLLENKMFLDFAQNNSLNIMNGKWLFKNIINHILEYLVIYKNDKINNQEICVLCNNLDETILEKIRELCIKVKICNVITNNIKQYKKMEEEIYQKNGIVLNISNNYKKTGAKSNIIINFDFTEKEIDKCSFSKNAYIININECKINKKELNEKNIISYKINLPYKYAIYKQVFDNFDENILYESFIYKKTSYKNIKKEIDNDNPKILYLEQFNGKKMQKQNENLSKTLDKITI